MARRPRLGQDTPPRRPIPRGESVTDYNDLKTFDGITQPVAFISTTVGQQTRSSKLTTMEINPTVDPKIFEKPAPK